MGFVEDIKRDWGNPEIYGPWTEELEKNDPPREPGTFKFYKSYYLITRKSDKPEIESFLPGAKDIKK